MVKKIALFALVAVVFFFIGRGSNSLFAGPTNFDEVDVTDGYKVDGNPVIDGSGGVSSTAANNFNGEVRAPLIEKGTIVTLTAATTTSITAAQACDGNIVNFAPAAVGASTTLPASSAWVADCLTVNGDSITQFLFRNTSSTGASTTIKVGDASTTLLGVDGVSDQIGGGSSALISVFRKATDTLDVIIRRYVDAD